MGCLALLANPQVAWSTSPQLDSLTPSITLHLKNTTVKEVIAEIENQGDFYFTYSTNHVNVNRKVSIDVKNNSVEKVLDQLFANEGIGYSIEDNHIVLYKQSQETQVASVKQEKRKSPVSSVTRMAPLSVPVSLKKEPPTVPLPISTENSTWK